MLLYGTSFSQELSYKSSTDEWNADSLGNYRVLVQFDGTGNVAKVHIPWRRRDDNAAAKKIIVQDGQTQQLVLNATAKNITSESGDIYFEPSSGKGIYYIYYMPYKNEGRANYPKGVYLSPVETASAEWLQTLNYAIAPNATAKEMQAVNEFSSNAPMEIAATKAEIEALLKKNQSKPFIVFPESRAFPVRMKNKLPYRWIKAGPSLSFTGEAARGEHYSFQLALFAIKQLEEVSLSFTDLRSSSGKIIPAKNISCLNNTGTRYDATPFSQKVQVPPGEVQSLWCLLQVPETVTKGNYTGKAVIHSKGNADVQVQVNINVADQLLEDGGISEPWKQTRLHWLNSTMAQENEVIPPYTPLKVERRGISLLGRKMFVGENGFPSQILSYFTKEMTGYATRPTPVFAGPAQFTVTKQGASNAMAWKEKGFEFTRKEPGTVSWKAESYNADLKREVNATLEFDGFVMYTVKLTALNNINIKDISLILPFTKNAARYMMGLGQKGGYRPGSFDWKWEVATKNQDGAWIGNVNLGLQYSLRDEKYSRPLNTNFYLQKPLLLPASWGNENKGGIAISEEGNRVNVNNYSGERFMQKGDTLFYNFTLLITPFHTINTDFQWETRFYHKYSPVSEVKAVGSTVINIHHANEINPWINYPFIEWRKMKSYIDSAHRLGLKVKIYNTVREVSNRAYETFPMRSLGHEIYSPGKGGGYSWLQEHIGDDYIAAWFVPSIKDAAIINSGMSRWHNYYVEGMNWLVKNVGIDGIYLDDVAFDRITMKRIKRVLTQNNPALPGGRYPGIIDLHSANQYNKNDGFNNSANLYMEHFPYLNRLWFGEYFDYESNSPDFFLTEVSGIPFGLMGEMLEKGGNPWRGMIYGMTNRMPYDGNDPGGIWKVWDDFGMKDSKMIGYWSDNCPVTTSNENVLATVYQKNNTALVSVASWNSTDTSITLNINWNKLGIDPSKAVITAPAVKNFQEEKTWNVKDSIPVEKGKGWLLLISEKQ
ncbi:MAG: hypothetical protein KF746_22455 [Chitinophagaceae bacterium]|nr:hypothetical protein [Chitinophagaceae bacterium]